MNAHETVRFIKTVYRRELRYAIWKFKRFGFRIDRVTIDRLAFRLGCNDLDWKAAARREAIYRLHLALDVDRTIFRHPWYFPGDTIGA